jgi:hypothetical protein
MSKLHQIGKITYEAWRKSMIFFHDKCNIEDPPQFNRLSSAEQDSWQAAGVAARNDGTILTIPDDVPTVPELSAARSISEDPESKP